MTDNHVTEFSESKHSLVWCRRGLKGLDCNVHDHHNLLAEKECNVPLETGSAPQALSVHWCAHLVPNKAKEQINTTSSVISDNRGTNKSEIITDGTMDGFAGCHGTI